MAYEEREILAKLGRAHREYYRLYQRLLDSGTHGVIDLAAVKCNAGEGFEHRETSVPSSDLFKLLIKQPTSTKRRPGD
jgi:hypothetical protein